MGIISKENANSESIFKHLCDQMKKLSAGVISVDEAKGQATLAKQANNILRFELDRAKYVDKFGQENLRNIEDDKDK